MDLEKIRAQRVREEAQRAIYRTAEGCEAAARFAYREMLHHFYWASMHVAEVVRLKAIKLP